MPRPNSRSLMSDVVAMAELLEPRRLFAGNVTVVWDTLSNTLFVTGDSKANEIHILSGEFTAVTGGSGTTINGGAGVSIPDLPNLVIRTGNGNDAVEINEPDPRQTVTVDTGNGNDSVTLRRSGSTFTGARGVNITTDNGNDSVLIDFGTIFDNFIGGDLKIDTGTGNDHITINENLHVIGNLFINGGKGRDVFNDDGLISVNGTTNVSGIETLI